ncbi:hypothetical protein SEUCBS140593_009584 [Sporothrix eucalyptigena]|uniref:FAD-binding domain-containing protein n=1 Tax=Sporothrix eucalyptigena TaxID=1812306 RepID=A0ABP0CZJ0_9PEZI
MRQPVFEIVIIGGGIAGLAAAAGLRGPGRSITILEQSSQHREIGAAISLQQNASSILAKWGLSDILRRYKGSRDHGFRVYNAQGERVREIPLSRDAPDADRVVYHRVDLLDALKEAALSPDSERPGPPAKLRLSSRTVSCDCAAGSVTLEDGTVITGDLVIAADGIHSNLRKCVTGTHTEATPTGISAYRIVVPTETLKQDPDITNAFDPAETWTSMVMGFDRRVIMGPCREGSLFSVVALVPDEHMHETSTAKSWTTQGSLEHLLESFDVFAPWLKSIFKSSPSLGLWQLRDLDPLPTWTKGRVILIGDAAHAMLPTMGQGASQSIEDAEALQAFFDDVLHKPTAEEVGDRLRETFMCRYERASLIQAYSRQQAQPATTQNGKSVTLDPVQFQEYSCKYKGAREWAAQRAVC